jgi:hypothetical protein
MELGEGIGIVTRLGAGSPGSLGSMSSRDKCHLDSKASTPFLRFTQAPSQRAPGALPAWVKWPGRPVDRSSPTNTKVMKHMELYLHSTVLLHAVNSYNFAFAVLQLPVRM